MRQPHKNGQTHSNNSSATANEFFECAWPFCEVGASRIKGFLKIRNTYKTFKEFWKTSVTPLKDTKTVSVISHSVVFIIVTFEQI